MAEEDTEDESKVRTAAQFTTTHWSLILAAGEQGIVPNAEAMETLCRLYWNPVYCFIRSQAWPEGEAIDLTQGFFAHMLESGLVRRADRQRGRFRSFLLGCVKRYLSDEHARANAAKRACDRTRVVAADITELEEVLVVPASASQRPDLAYDYACAVSLINEALRLLEEECAANGRVSVFGVLKPYLQGDAATPGHAETARLLGTTPGTVGVTVHRLRQRYRVLLRSVVAQTLSDPLAVDDELQSLQEILESR